MPTIPEEDENPLTTAEVPTAAAGLTEVKRYTVKSPTDAKIATRTSLLIHAELPVEAHTGDFLAEAKTPATTLTEVRAPTEDKVATRTSLLPPGTPAEGQLPAPTEAEGHTQPAEVKAPETAEVPPGEAPASPEAVTLTTAEASPGEAPTTPEVNTPATDVPAGDETPADAPTPATSAKVQPPAPSEAEGHTQPAEAKFLTTPTETNNTATPFGEGLSGEVPATPTEAPASP